MSDGLAIGAYPLPARYLLKSRGGAGPGTVAQPLVILQDLNALAGETTELWELCGREQEHEEGGEWSKPTQPPHPPLGLVSPS